MTGKIWCMNATLEIGPTLLQPTEKSLWHKLCHDYFQRGKCQQNHHLDHQAVISHSGLCEPLAYQYFADKSTSQDSTALSERKTSGLDFGWLVTGRRLLDESHFQSFRENRKVCFGLKLNEIADLSCSHRTVKESGHTVVPAVYSVKHGRLLIPLDASLNGPVYQNLFAHHFHHFMVILNPQDGRLFQQDNAPATRTVMNRTIVRQAFYRF